MLLFFCGFLLSVLSSMALAFTATCAAGDPGCIISTIAKANLAPTEAHLLLLDASTFTFTRQDNGTEGLGFTATPILQASLTIRGQGAAFTTLERSTDRATPLFRLLHVGPEGQLTLEGLTIQHGAVSPIFFNRGGGVLSEGALVVTDSVVRLNEAWLGGGIHSARAAPLVLRRVAVTDNTGDFLAGGVTAAGETLIEDCLIADNIAESGGGIAFDPAGKVLIRNSVIAGNVAFLIDGGGLDGGGDVTLRNTVLLDNSSGLRGGALNLSEGSAALQGVACVGNGAAIFGGCAFVASGTFEVQRSAIVGNRTTEPFGVGGGVFSVPSLGARVLLRQSVLAGNTSFRGPDCNGIVEAQDGAVIGDATDCDVRH